MADLKKKSISGTVIYTLILLAYIFILGAGILYGLGKLWTFAAEYENAIPSKVMDAYIADLNENLWDASIEQTIENMPHEFQSNEEVAALVQEMFSSELTYARTIGGDGENSIVYAILCDGNAFGRVTIVRDQSKAAETEFGSLPWMIQSEEFDFTGLYSSLQITVPQSYSVSLNGHILGAANVIESGIPYDVLAEYYEDHPNLPTKVTYKAEHILGHIDPVLYDDQGNVTSIDPNRDDSQFIRPIDAEIYQRLEYFAVAFADPYLAYSSNVVDPNTGYANVEGFLYPNGDLAERLKLTKDGYEWAHTTSYRFEGAQLVNAISLGDGYYSIDINAQTVITYPNKGENGIVHDNNGLRVLVTDYNGQFRALSVERYMVGQS